MLHNRLVLAILAATSVLAQEIERNDIPNDCRTICEPVITLSRACDQENDQQERDCICSSINQPAFEVCNECTLRYPDYFVDADDNDDADDANDNDNEVNVWYSRCGFGNATTSGTVTATPTIRTASLSTSVFTTTLCDDDANEDPNDDDVCVTRVVTGVVPVLASTTGPSGSTVVVATSTDASGSVVTYSTTTAGPTGTQTTLATQTTQTSSVSTFDGGAMAMGIPMLGAGAGMVLAALAAL